MLPWQQHSRCHSVSFLMLIAGAKFEEHCFNISSYSRLSGAIVVEPPMTSSLVIQKHKYL